MWQETDYVVSVSYLVAGDGLMHEVNTHIDELVFMGGIVRECTTVQPISHQIISLYINIEGNIYFLPWYEL